MNGKGKSRDSLQKSKKGPYFELAVCNDVFNISKSQSYAIHTNNNNLSKIKMLHSFFFLLVIAFVQGRQQLSFSNGEFRIVQVLFPFSIYSSLPIYIMEKPKRRITKLQN